MDEDIQRVLEHVAKIPIAQFGTYIQTSMPNEIIETARRVLTHQLERL